MTTTWLLLALLQGWDVAVAPAGEGYGAWWIAGDRLLVTHEGEKATVLSLATGAAESRLTNVFPASFNGDTIAAGDGLIDASSGKRIAVPELGPLSECAGGYVGVRQRMSGNEVLDITLVRLTAGGAADWELPLWAKGGKGPGWDEIVHCGASGTVMMKENSVVRELVLITPKGRPTWTFTQDARQLASMESCDYRVVEIKGKPRIAMLIRPKGKRQTLLQLVEDGKAKTLALDGIEPRFARTDDAPGPPDPWWFTRGESWYGVFWGRTKEDEPGFVVVDILKRKELRRVRSPNPEGGLIDGDGYLYETGNSLIDLVTGDVCVVMKSGRSRNLFTPRHVTEWTEGSGRIKVHPLDGSESRTIDLRASALIVPEASPARPERLVYAAQAEGGAFAVGVVDLEKGEAREAARYEGRKGELTRAAAREGQILILANVGGTLRAVAVAPP